MAEDGVFGEQLLQNLHVINTKTIIIAREVSIRPHKVSQFYHQTFLLVFYAIIKY